MASGVREAVSTFVSVLRPHCSHPDMAAFISYSPSCVANACFYSLTTLLGLLVHAVHTNEGSGEVLGCIS